MRTVHIIYLCVYVAAGFCFAVAAWPDKSKTPGKNTPTDVEWIALGLFFTVVVEVSKALVAATDA